MEQILMQRNFKTFIKGFHFLTKLLLVVLTIAILLGICLSAAIAFIPSEKLITLIEKGEVQAGLTFAGVYIELSEKVVTGFQFAKQPLLLLFLITCIYLAVLLVITYWVQCIVKDIKNQQVFTMKTSRYIEWIAYGVLVMSLLLQPIQMLAVSAFNELFNLEIFIKNSDWIQSVSYDYFNIHWSLLFSAIIIWIIAKVFKYGVFLQEEFDATL